MSDQKLNLDAHDDTTKKYAFNSIMVNAVNDKMTDSDFREFIINTWLDKMLPKKDK